ncbi:hypothetical protein GGF46_002817 [Coemansia sp. RSA 552]|nr:hypothetical protein GGF46_002817 [Coemansia sp. RSA 552]
MDDSEYRTSGYRAAPARAKRIQVKNACVNCQRACKKCDSGRPCTRCIKLGLVATCEDSKRKPRQKGIKRGPYKKRSNHKQKAATPPHQLPASPPPDRIRAYTVLRMPPVGVFGQTPSPPTLPSDDDEDENALSPVGAGGQTPSSPPALPSDDEHALSPLSMLSDVALESVRSHTPVSLASGYRLNLPASTPRHPISAARFAAAYRGVSPAPSPGPEMVSAPPPPEATRIRRLSELLDQTHIGYQTSSVSPTPRQFLSDYSIPLDSK